MMTIAPFDEFIQFTSSRREKISVMKITKACSLTAAITIFGSLVGGAKELKVIIVSLCMACLVSCGGVREAFEYAGEGYEEGGLLEGVLRTAFVPARAIVNTAGLNGSVSARDAESLGNAGLHAWGVSEAPDHADSLLDSYNRTQAEIDEKYESQ